MTEDMKYMFASDIHGSALYAEQMKKAFEEEKADRLILLGDLLYHGPRNDLPEGYEPKKVIDILNSMADCILAVRGNCEAEVDQMVLSFPVTADYAVMEYMGRLLYLTHGHVFGEDNPPKLKKGDVLICGHTHVPKCSEHEGFIYMNPGSVSIPKEMSPHGYMVTEENDFVWKSFSSGEWLRYTLKNS